MAKPSTTNVAKPDFSALSAEAAAAAATSHAGETPLLSSVLSEAIEESSAGQLVSSEFADLAAQYAAQYGLAVESVNEASQRYTPFAGTVLFRKGKMSVQVSPENGPFMAAEITILDCKRGHVPAVLWDELGRGEVVSLPLRNMKDEESSKSFRLKEIYDAPEGSIFLLVPPEFKEGKPFRTPTAGGRSFYAYKFARFSPTKPATAAESVAGKEG